MLSRIFREGTRVLLREAPRSAHHPPLTSLEGVASTAKSVKRCDVIKLDVRECESLRPTAWCGGPQVMVLWAAASASLYVNGLQLGGVWCLVWGWTRERAMPLAFEECVRISCHYLNCFIISTRIITGVRLCVQVLNVFDTCRKKRSTKYFFF